MGVGSWNDVYFGLDTESRRYLLLGVYGKPIPSSFTIASIYYTIYIYYSSLNMAKINEPSRQLRWNNDELEPNNMAREEINIVRL